MQTTLTREAPPLPALAVRDPVRVDRLARLFCWLGPAVVTAFVVAYRAAEPQLWRDELATWSAATRTVPQIFALGRHIDGVTVPYYLLEHLAVGLFGDSALALRLPSLLAATATAAVTGLLARRLWGARAAVLAGLLVSAMPVVSRYGQEARGYVFAALFAVVSTLLLLRALELPRWRRWLAYGAGVLALGWSHQVALLLLLGHAVAVVTTDWRLLRRWLPAVTLAAGGVLPFFVLGLEQHDRQLNWLFAAEPADLATVAQTIFLSGVLGGAVCALAVTAVRTRTEAALFLSALLPVLALYAVDQLITPVFVGRYLFFVVPLLCALAGQALARSGLLLGPAIVVVLALIGLPVQDDIRRSHSPFDYRQAAQVIEANARPGDGIVYAPRWGWQFTDIAMRYYLGEAVPRDVLLKDDEVASASLWATECADAAVCLRGAERVWTVSADNLETGRRAGVTDQLTPAERAALAASYHQVLQTRLEGFTIALYIHR
ncbi:glycosyltransferase family 39 protein [Actinoplanes sp. NPDC049681]|uniref:glycosyltransferase family 39 protein n=1 Tax=Actinoplanes sp. NPDC049681 TaxID=3363905 RepID=UPI00379BC4D3